MCEYMYGMQVYVCMERRAVTTQFRRLGFRSLLLSLFVRFAGGDCRIRPDSMKTKKTILHSEPSTLTFVFVDGYMCVRGRIGTYLIDRHMYNRN